MFPRALMIPIRVPARLGAMSSMAHCSPAYVKPVRPTARVSRVMARVGLSPANAVPGVGVLDDQHHNIILPSRAIDGTPIAIVFATFLAVVFDIIFFSMIKSTRTEPALDTIHITRYGSPARNA